jgi:hypothetical protein
VFIERNGLVVQITGKDTMLTSTAVIGGRIMFVSKDVRAGYAVHVVHGSVIPVVTAASLPFIPNITTAEEVAEADPSRPDPWRHWHYPFEVCERGRWIVNPARDGAVCPLPKLKWNVRPRSFWLGLPIRE